MMVPSERLPAAGASSRPWAGQRAHSSSVDVCMNPQMSTPTDAMAAMPSFSMSCMRTSRFRAGSSLFCFAACHHVDLCMYISAAMGLKFLDSLLKSMLKSRPRLKVQMAVFCPNAPMKVIPAAGCVFCPVSAICSCTQEGRPAWRELNGMGKVLGFHMDTVPRNFVSMPMEGVNQPDLI